MPRLQVRNCMIISHIFLSNFLVESHHCDRFSFAFHIVAYVIFPNDLLQTTDYPHIHFHHCDRFSFAFHIVAYVLFPNDLLQTTDYPHIHFYHSLFSFIVHAFQTLSLEDTYLCMVH
jgi:hypothetical protein